jgi:hypothetical protein
MIWAAISTDHIIGLDIFDDICHMAYLNMFQAWFVLQLRESGFESTCIMQQDVALTQYVPQL